MKVLLGLAGTDESMRALQTTIERTAGTGDDLTIAVGDHPELERSGRELIDEVDRLLEESNVDADIHKLEGNPGSELVELAEREEFDQLVIGGGTESPMGKIRLGPVTEFILLNARTTVKLIR